MSALELIKYYKNLIKNYPIISIEDGLDENDWEGWNVMTEEIGNKCQLVGDDFLLLQLDRLRIGISKNCGNSILIKPKSNWNFERNYRNNK